MNFKKISSISIILLISLSSFAQNTIYSYKVKDIDGKEFDFASLKANKNNDS